jgi:hypothetical protein
MKILILLPVLAGLSGCFHHAVVREPVNVEVPIPFCPAPPAVVKCDFLVDKLTDADINDPGKVGQAYKADMVCLRGAYDVHNQILDQYTKTSQSFEEVQKRIRELADKMKAASTTVE